MIKFPPTIRHFFKRSVNEGSMHEPANGSTEAHLKSLRPTKGLASHSLYVEELSRAVDDGDIQNIALTGSYGAGKSSILRDFTEIKKYKKKSLQVSFSSLGANIQDYIKEGGKSEKYEKLNNLANLIQKEIVKQILFKEKAGRIPHSRFRRVTSPSVLPLATASLVISTLMLAIAIANGWLGSLFDAVSLYDYSLRIVETALIYIIMFSSLLLFLIRIGGKIQVSKIGSSAVSLSLSGENNYFDEYLDEIIYFFEAAKYQIVIFEDIDRFDSLYIFENLRQLNTILNNSNQIKDKVTFIYAVKDSIFSQDVIDDEVQSGDHKERSANRTKFFDLIIPVVPFITNISSRELMLKEFNEEYQEELKKPVAIVSKYITDMRLVKNIYNEFLIFKQKVVLENSDLALDRLFAMVAYKNWNLDDFERIKDGDSLIDRAIEAHSRFIELESSRLATKINDKRTMISSVNSIDTRFSSLGEHLTVYIENTLSRLDSTLQSITLNGAGYSKEDLKTQAFWEEVLSRGDDNTLIVSYQPRRIGYTLSLTLNTGDLRTVTQDNLDKNEWAKLDTAKLKSEIEELVSKQSELSHMGMKDLLDNYDDFHITLSDVANGKIAQDKMMWELIEAGYINDEFIHYTSIFHEYTMSLQARSFWLNNINQNKVSMYHKFANDNDVEALLEELGSVYFKEKSMYNIHIVDYLLSSSDQRVKHIISNLSSGEDNDIQFIDAYVKSGREVDEFVKRLAHEWPEIFMHTVSHSEMDDKKKAYFISLALGSGNTAVKYYTDNMVSEFIDKHARNIPILNKTEDDTKLEAVSLILDTLNVSFTSFDGLSEPTRKKVQNVQLYAINADNLQSVLGEPRLPLDEIRAVDKVTYGHILANLEDYIGLYPEMDSGFMLAGKHEFEVVIDDVSKTSFELLDIILSRADHANCIVDDINRLPMETWSTLIKYAIPSNTLSNVLLYFNFYNSENENESVVGDELAAYLNTAKTITLDKEYGEFDHEQVVQLVTAVLNSNDINDDTKVAIAVDCYAEEYIDIETLAKREGALFGALVKNGVIEDDVASFNHIRELSWETRKAYIINSSEFTSYIGELDIVTEELDSLVSDNDIPSEIKLHIAKSILSFSSVMSISIARKVANIAASNSLSLDYDSIELLADGGGVDDVVQLLNNSSGELTLDNYTNILESLGGEYKKLTQNSKRPTFDATDHNLKLITKLEELGAVSSHTAGDKLKVVMKPRWR